MKVLLKFSADNVTIWASCTQCKASKQQMLVREREVIQLCRNCGAADWSNRFVWLKDFDCVLPTLDATIRRVSMGKTVADMFIRFISDDDIDSLDDFILLFTRKNRRKANQWIQKHGRPKEYALTCDLAMNQRNIMNQTSMRNFRLIGNATIDK